MYTNTLKGHDSKIHEPTVYKIHEIIHLTHIICFSEVSEVTSYSTLSTPVTVTEWAHFDSAIIRWGRSQGPVGGESVLASVSGSPLKTS